MSQPRIGLQLYSVREDAERDLLATLERAARIGFEGVETAGLFGASARDVRARAGDLGLAVCAAHDAPGTGEDPRQVVDRAAETGADALIFPLLLPERLRSRSALVAAASELSQLAALAAERGLAFGYHNHDWELRIQIDGESAHSALLAELPDRVLVELDVYWAQVGGADVCGELVRLGRRARWLHLKDGPADDPAALMTALGEGRLDLPRILSHARADWWVVEIDACDGDVWRAVESSLRYLTAARADLPQPR